MTKNILILQPIHPNSTDILRCFALGKPLSSEQQNFLEWHQQQLSSAEFDPVLKYYIESNKKRRKKYQTTFLLPHEELNKEDIQRLKKRIKIFLQNKNRQIVISITQKQFLQFKELNLHELIFWHGNQTLTGAPFFPGGIPPVIFFQWGNLFGVVKYVILSEEKSLKSNILIYFEDMVDRDLNRCVQEYTQRLDMALEQQNKILTNFAIEPPILDQFLIKTPVLKP